MGTIERYIATLAQPTYEVRLRLNPLLTLVAHRQEGTHALRLESSRRIPLPLYPARATELVWDSLALCDRATAIIHRACESEAAFAGISREVDVPELESLLEGSRVQKRHGAELYADSLANAGSILDNAHALVQGTEGLLVDASDYVTATVQSMHDARYEFRTAGRIFGDDGARLSALLSNLFSLGTFNRSLRAHRLAHAESYLAWRLIATVTDAAALSFSSNSTVPAPLIAPLERLRACYMNLATTSRHARDRMQRLVTDDARFLSTLGVSEPEPRLDTLLASLG